MDSFSTKRLPVQPDGQAPDGSLVKVLLQLGGGSMAQFELASGHTSRAVAHRTVEEIWFFLDGEGQMWRRLNDRDEVVDVAAGVCVTLPLGTHFQFRSTGEKPLVALGITMPPWPGADEAYEVPGIWLPTL